MSSKAIRESARTFLIDQASPEELCFKNGKSDMACLYQKYCSWAIRSNLITAKRFELVRLANELRAERDPEFAKDWAQQQEKKAREKAEWKERERAWDNERYRVRTIRMLCAEAFAMSQEDCDRFSEIAALLGAPNEIVIASKHLKELGRFFSAAIELERVWSAWAKPTDIKEA